jgi:2-methylfumaryl-CoA isomerase
VTVPDADGAGTPDATDAPLDGLRIIELSTYVAGPSGAMTLAQLGADVIRVDPIGGATDYRRLPLGPNGLSLYWAGLNKAKRSVEVDVTSDEGRELIGAMVGAPGSQGGVLLTNAVGQSWLSHESMCKYRADLITVHIMGRSDGKPAVDYTVNCEVGLPNITGPIDIDRPVNHVLPAWDLMTGLHAAIGVLAAERVRSRTGRGQLINIALGDVAVATMSHLGFVADVVMNGRSRMRDGNYLYGSFGCDFATSDNQRVMIVALSESHWRKLISVTGIAGAIAALEESLQVDFDQEEVRYQYRNILEALMRPWFESHTLDELAKLLDAGRILWGPYRSLDNFVNDPASLLHISGLMSEVAQPGIGTYPIPRAVLDFSLWTDCEPAPAPVLGADTDGTLRQLLGLSDRELALLRERGVIGGGRG